MSCERKGEKVKPGIYKVYNGSDNLLPKILNSTNAHFDGDITEVEICIYYD